MFLMWTNNWLSSKLERFSASDLISIFELSILNKNAFNLQINTQGDYRLGLVVIETLLPTYLIFTLMRIKEGGGVPKSEAKILYAASVHRCYFCWNFHRWFKLNKNVNFINMTGFWKLYTYDLIYIVYLCH